MTRHQKEAPLTKAGRLNTSKRENRQAGVSRKNEEKQAPATDHLQQVSNPRTNKDRADKDLSGKKEKAGPDDRGRVY